MSIPSVPHTPANPNQMHPNKFTVKVACLPTVEYWCQNVNVPGLSLGEAPRTTPFIDLYAPGEKLIMNPFSITFIVDEDMNGWLEVYKWMRGLTFPKEFSEYRNLDKRFAAWSTPMPQYSDITLNILDTKQNPKIRVKFENCFPTSLSDLLLSATAGPDDPMTADVVFRFDKYEIEIL